MKRIRIILFLLTFSVLNIDAQKSNIFYDLGSSAGYITPGHVPFWLRSNQFGSIPLDKGSLSLIGSVRKEFDHNKHRLFDWGGCRRMREYWVYDKLYID